VFLPERLAKLAPAHRLRKAALLLEVLEREGLAALRRNQSPLPSFNQAFRIAQILNALHETPREVVEAGDMLLSFSPNERASVAPSLTSEDHGDALRALDAFRHALLREGGQSRADWDLIDPDTGLAAEARRPLIGLRVYFEDIRSPFNVGSMLRTAEAFGFEEALLSPSCADPIHPRAQRSAMGAASLLPWRRAGLEALVDAGPAFALELGGAALGSFDFPESGIVVVGSEELGVSRNAIELCALGAVSIPMRGAKASINVGVAFGILANVWTSKIG